MATFLSLKTDPQNNYSEPESVISLGFVISQCPYLSSPLPPHLHPREKQWPLCSGAPEPHSGGSEGPQGTGTHVAVWTMWLGPRLTQAGQSDLQSVASDYTLFPVDRQREP